MKNKYIIFDLDDTLTYEIDYLKSAYYEIASKIDEKNSKMILRKCCKCIRIKKMFLK